MTTSFYLLIVCVGIFVLSIFGIIFAFTTEKDKLANVIGPLSLISIILSSMASFVIAGISADSKPNDYTNIPVRNQYSDKVISVSYIQWRPFMEDEVKQVILMPKQIKLLKNVKVICTDDVSFN